jgi:exodeoxyribonuclease VII small subunit
VATSDPKTLAPAASFEAALAELETIVDTMEGGQLPLADSLAAYKRGAELLQYCQAALQDAQQQVQVLERGVLRNLDPDGDAPEDIGDDEA